MRKTGIRKLETALLAVGLTLLAIFLGFRIHGTVASRAALLEFAARASQSPASGTARALPESRDVDFRLWSAKRIESYKQSLATTSDGPIAVLTIPRISLEVPVFEGTDELTLNRGAGRIAGTAEPAQAGNIGIAGHRDGFFRVLKDVRLGDTIELTTLEGKLIYTVDALKIVEQDDVSVLDPEERPALTLVTCYPFYFVGPAPKRYIVHASIVERDSSNNSQRNAEVRTNHKKEVY